MKTKVVLGVLWAVTAANLTFVFTMVGLYS